MPTTVVIYRVTARDYRSSRDGHAARSAAAAKHFRIDVDRAVVRVEAEAWADKK
jgi:hypothetical protein